MVSLEVGLVVQMAEALGSLDKETQDDSLHEVDLAVPVVAPEVNQVVNQVVVPVKEVPEDSHHEVDLAAPVANLVVLVKEVLVKEVLVDNLREVDLVVECRTGLGFLIKYI